MNGQIKKDLIAARIQGLADANGGRITPDLVIEDARNPESPLHGEFNWNTEEAAMAYWRDTARKIIASVEVVVTIEKIAMKVPVYIRDPEADRQTQGYVRTCDLKRDTAHAAICNEVQRVADSLRRVKLLAASLGMEDAAEELLGSVLNFKDAIAQKKAA